MLEHAAEAERIKRLAKFREDNLMRLQKHRSQRVDVSIHFVVGEYVNGAFMPCQHLRLYSG